jgi:CHAT domain-containing protein
VIRGAVPGALAAALILTTLQSAPPEIPDLLPGQPVERAIASETHSYRIAMVAGTVVSIIVDQRGIDVAESIYGPDEKLAAGFNEEWRPTGKESMDLVAAQTGTYRLEIKPAMRGISGRYEVSVSAARPASEHDQSLFEAHYLFTRSMELTARGEDSQAIALTRRAIEITEKESGPDHPDLASLLNLAGFEGTHTGDYQPSEAMFLRAQAINEKTLGPGNPHSAESARFLGAFYSARGDSVRAEPLLRKALEIMEATAGPDHPQTLRCLLDSSALHLRNGDNSRAEEELRRALAIADKSLDDNALLAAASLNNLAVVYNGQKDYKRAEPLLNRSVEMVERTLGPDSPLLALQFQNLGLIAQERDRDYPKALDYYSRAAAMLVRDGSTETPRRAGILNNMANVYKSMGDYAKAAELHGVVHGIAERQLGPYSQLVLISLGNLANTYAAAGDLPRALDYQQQTDATIEKNLTLNLAVGSERQKLAYFDSLSARTSRTITLQTGLAASAPGSAEMAALAVLQRKGRVLDAMSQSFAALRQRSLPDDRRVFDELMAATGEFATLALNGRGKLTAADYEKRLASLAEKKEQLEAELSRRSEEFRAQSQAVTLPAVQAAIPTDAVLVEYAAYRPFDPRSEVYGEPRYVVYLLRHEGGVQWAELGPSAKIDSAVDVFRKSLRDPRSQTVERDARELDRLIMQPVRKLAGDANHLLVSPDGSLNLIPFEALMDEHQRYLVERYAITYLTSGRDLLRMQVTREARSGPVLIANPDFGEPPVAGAMANRPEVYFAQLKGTELEATTINKLFPAARVLTGREASETALKHVEAPSFLHIATHGFFLETAHPDVKAQENPLLRSGLALAGANLNHSAPEDGDGVFTALEASSLDLWGTQLVTLSACDTGVGEFRNGDGVYGLRRAFFLAGAQTLVMSMWPVSDYVTRQIMTSYYTGLSQGLGRGEALRQTQLALLRRDGRRHPFYWASFIQAGDWKSLQPAAAFQ